MQEGQSLLGGQKRDALITKIVREKEVVDKSSDERGYLVLLENKSNKIAQKNHHHSLSTYQASSKYRRESDVQ
ncbi:hypothetical protein evm_006414 [Chilo suppressalis]|nr:hypothetical protein evm_006414 [Chilo suppressalis]